jgi:rhamnogalacturonan endolyase
VKLNKQPLTQSTNYVDQGVDGTLPTAYVVRAVLNGKEQAASAPFTLPANAPAQPYLTIPLHTPVGYTPNDASTGDLDGDGNYDIVLHQTGRGRDNGQVGLTDPPVLEGYKMDGTLLWRINLGHNIRGVVPSPLPFRVATVLYLFAHGGNFGFAYLRCSNFNKRFMDISHWFSSKIDVRD